MFADTVDRRRTVIVSRSVSAAGALHLAALRNPLRPLTRNIARGARADARERQGQLSGSSIPCLGAMKMPVASASVSPRSELRPETTTLRPECDDTSAS